MSTEAKSYEPTIAQALFGAAYGPIEAPDYIAEDLYRLSEILAHRNPETQAHGFLGGEYGYGQNFANPVFEMFPYWWGDCDCGGEQRREAWEDANPHEPECYQTALAVLRAEKDHACGWDRPGPVLVPARSETIDGVTMTEYRSAHPPIPRHVIQKADAVYEAKQEALCKERGLSYPEGCECHCTCGRDDRYVAWDNEHGACAPRCSDARPNFVHKASGLEVRWYKYIGRGMTLNRPTTPEEWAGIMRECIGSVAS